MICDATNVLLNSFILPYPIAYDINRWAAVDIVPLIKENIVTTPPTTLYIP